MLPDSLACRLLVGIEWGVPGTWVPNSLQIELELVKGKNAYQKTINGKRVEILDRAWSNTIECTMTQPLSTSS